MRRILALAVCVLALTHTAANAFFFFFVPIPGSSGYCAGAGVKVGDRITIPNKGTGYVTSVAAGGGTCPTAQYPVVVGLDFGAANVIIPTGSESTECVPQGSRPGDRVTLSVSKETVVVKGLRSSGANCSDPKLPIEATVVHPGSPEPLPNQSPAMKPTSAATPPISVAPTISATPTAASTEQGGTAQKLRELSALLKDGVITQEDFDAKKRELLKSY